jgi:hypothetical protein
MCQGWNYFGPRALLVFCGKAGGRGTRPPGGKGEGSGQGENEGEGLKRKKGGPKIRRGTRETTQQQGEEQGRTKEEGEEKQGPGLKPSRWDRSINSLSSTLHLIFPEFFPKTESPPIPEHPPSTLVCPLLFGLPPPSSFLLPPSSFLLPPSPLAPASSLLPFPLPSSPSLLPASCLASCPTYLSTVHLWSKVKNESKVKFMRKSETSNFIICRQYVPFTKTEIFKKFNKIFNFFNISNFLKKNFRENGVECKVKGTTKIFDKIRVGATILVQHDGIFPTSKKLKRPVFLDCQE